MQALLYDRPATVYHYEPPQPPYLLPINDGRGEGAGVRPQLGGEDVRLPRGPALGGREDEEGGVTLILTRTSFPAWSYYSLTAYICTQTLLFI